MVEYKSSPAGRETALLRIVDLDTGKDVNGYQRLPLGQLRGYMIAEDFSMFVAISAGDIECQPTCLHLVDVREWVVENIPLDLPSSPDLWFPWIAYDKVRDRLLIHHTERSRVLTLYSFSLRSHLLSRLLEFDFAPLSLRFSPDRSKIYIYGTKSQANQGVIAPSWAASIDLENDRLIWEAPLPGVKDGQEQIGEGSGPESMTWWSPAVVFQPEGDYLWVIHAHEDRLTTVNFTHQTIETKPILPAMSWFEKWLFLDADPVQAKILKGTQKQAIASPDGKKLFVVSMTTNPVVGEEPGSIIFEQESTLTVLDPIAGTLINEWETKSSRITSFSRGSAFYLTAWEQTDQDYSVWTDIYQMDGQPANTRVDGYELIPSYRLDGSPILVSSKMLSNDAVEFSVFEIGASVPFVKWEEEDGEAYNWVIQLQP